MSKPGSKSAQLGAAVEVADGALEQVDSDEAEGMVSLTTLVVDICPGHESPSASNQYELTCAVYSSLSFLGGSVLSIRVDAVSV